jgi:hypothetical protein
VNSRKYLAKEFLKRKKGMEKPGKAGKRSHVFRVPMAGDESFEGPQNNLINKIGQIVIKKYCNLEI